MSKLESAHGLHAEPGATESGRAMPGSIDARLRQWKPAVPAWAYELAPDLRETRVVRLIDSISATLQFSRGSDAGLVTAVVANASELSAQTLRTSVSLVFKALLDWQRTQGFPHPVRMWSFLPQIHGRMGEELDRYRVFNMGRHDAFSQWFGGPSKFGRALPAASALGHAGNDLLIGSLALRTPGVPVENPRQTPAFEYPKVHGPKPPCFSRAMIAELPLGTRLLVSGTASIRGDDSLHEGSLDKQLDETFENLERLVTSAPGIQRFSLSNIETARVYYSRPDDRAALIHAIGRRLPAAATVEYVPAWICRAELLVEIEATLAPVSS